MNILILYYRFIFHIFQSIDSMKTTFYYMYYVLRIHLPFVRLMRRIIRNENDNANMKDFSFEPHNTYNDRSGWMVGDIRTSYIYICICWNLTVLIENKAIVRRHQAASGGIRRHQASLVLGNSMLRIIVVWRWEW